MLNLRPLLLLGFLIGIAGCATQPAVHKGRTGAPGKSALIYFYRPRSTVGATISMDVQDNAIDLGTLSDGTYFAYHANPGVHNFTLITDTTATQSVRLQAGITYYARVRIERTGQNYRPRFDIVFDLQGQSAIHNLHRLDYGE